MTKCPGEELTARQRRILAAVVEEHVASGAPVGSKTVHNEYGVEASTATIRYEMAELADQGYLAQPHPSAGRIPTQQGYRFHISKLETTTLPPLRQSSWVHRQYRRIDTDMDTVLRITTKVLSQLTRQPALSTAVSAIPADITEIHATPVSAHTIRISYTYSDGSSQELVVRSSQVLTGQQIRQLDQALVKHVRGGQATNAGELEKLLAGDGVPVPPSVIRSVAAQLTSSRQGPVYVDGTAHILNYPEFCDEQRLRALMQILDEEAAVHQLLQATGPSEVTVLIGSEHGNPALTDCSLVAKRFGDWPPQGRPSCTVGVVGPMRIAYGQVMSAVACVADHADYLLSSEA